MNQLYILSQKKVYKLKVTILNITIMRRSEGFGFYVCWKEEVEEAEEEEEEQEEEEKEAEEEVKTEEEEEEVEEATSTHSVGVLKLLNILH